MGKFKRGLNKGGRHTSDIASSKKVVLKRDLRANTKTRVKRRKKKRVLSKYRVFYRLFMGYLRKRRFETSEKGGLSFIVRYAWGKLKVMSPDDSAEVMMSNIDYWIDGLFLVRRVEVDKRRYSRVRGKSYTQRTLNTINLRKFDASRVVLLDEWIRNRHLSFEWWFFMEHFPFFSDRRDLFNDSIDNFVISDEEGTSITFLSYSDLLFFYRDLKKADKQGLFVGIGEYPTFVYTGVRDRVGSSEGGLTVTYQIAKYIFGSAFVGEMTAISGSGVSSDGASDSFKAVPTDTGIIHTVEMSDEQKKLRDIFGSRGSSDSRKPLNIVEKRKLSLSGEPSPFDTSNLFGSNKGLSRSSMSSDVDDRIRLLQAEMELERLKIERLKLEAASASKSVGKVRSRGKKKSVKRKKRK